MKVFNHVKGVLGEDLATKYLKKKHFKILERNHRNKVGEIDIVAMQKKTLVFVEVKSRSTLEFGRPAEAVNAHKQHKLRQVASLYLISHKLDIPCRFDVIEILDGQVINHIENAF